MRLWTKTVHPQDGTVEYTWERLVYFRRFRIEFQRPMNRRELARRQHIRRIK